MIAEKVGGTPDCVAVMPLQWGRDQMIAEKAPLDSLPQDLVPLQWGRDQMIAEKRADALKRLSAVVLASMGPRSDDRGKPSAR